MSASSNWDIRLLDWTQAAPLVMPLRERVFVVEQGVPAAIELDEFDPVCRHAVGRDANGRVIATGRLLPDGHIGRMAVDARWRSRGIGGAVLEALVREARTRGLREVVVNAQIGALDFYFRHGFSAEGEVFVEAGIDHRAMRRAL